MTDARLKQTERQDVFRRLRDHGFDPNAFTWTEKRDQESFRSSMGGGDQVVVSVLIHNSTDYYMRFGAFANEYSPAEGRRVDFDDHDLTWETRIRSCNTWLTELRKEVEVPDLWAEVGKERALAEAASSEGLENTPFTADEKALISESLQAIKSQIVAMGHLETQEAAIVDSRFKHLEEAMHRIGRKEWLMLTIGTLVTVIVALSLSREQGNQVLYLAGTLLHRLWTGMHALGQ